MLHRIFPGLVIFAGRNRYWRDHHALTLCHRYCCGYPDRVRSEAVFLLGSDCWSGHTRLSSVLGGLLWKMTRVSTGNADSD